MHHCVAFVWMIIETDYLEQHQVSLIDDLGIGLIIFPVSQGHGNQAPFKHDFFQVLFAATEFANIIA